MTSHCSSPVAVQYFIRVETDRLSNPYASRNGGMGRTHTDSSDVYKIIYSSMMLTVVVCPLDLLDTILRVTRFHLSVIAVRLCVARYTYF